ncbi:MAG: hypothetical protein JWQ26_1764 [Modestobacter sp.]|nr:hypothetical protein [Modestobacter sp.]
MAEPTFARTGPASRRPATPPATGAPRRKPSLVAPQQVDGQAPVSQLEEVTVRLAVALDALDESTRRRVQAYRGHLLSDAEWTQVADLVHLGLAASPTSGTRAMPGLAAALCTHARIHLLLGTSRTVAGWYGHDAIETSLTTRRVGRGPAAFTPPERFASSYQSRLRAIGRTLVPNTPPPPPNYGAYDPQAPLTTAELEEVFDFCDAHRSHRFGARLGQRLATLVWLTCGTGVRNADLVEVRDGKVVHVLGTAVERTPHAVVFTTAGPASRRVPVLGSCEAPVLDAAIMAGDGQLLRGLRSSNDVTDSVVRATGWDRDRRFPVTAGRLRQTWLAAVLSADVPYPAVLRAAGISGERTLAALVARLPQLDEAAYETALRCTSGPLPTVGQLLLPGERLAAPRVPLRAQS